MAIRSLIMSIHGFFFALSQFILPLPIVHTVACSGTLIIFIIDYILNHITVNIKQIIGICIGIAGAILATNGKIITKYLYP